METRLLLSENYELVAVRTRSAGFGFVNTERTAAEIVIVERFDGSGCVGIFHFDKTEATSTAGFPVANKFDRKNLAVFGKEGLNLLLGG